MKNEEIKSCRAVGLMKSLDVLSWVDGHISWCVEHHNL